MGFVSKLWDGAGGLSGIRSIDMDFENFGATKPHKGGGYISDSLLVSLKEANEST